MGKGGFGFGLDFEGRCVMSCQVCGLDVFIFEMDALARRGGDIQHILGVSRRGCFRDTWSFTFGGSLLHLSVYFR